MFDEEWEKMDKKAMVTIFFSPSSKVLLNVATKKTSKGLWDPLSDTCMKIMLMLLF